ncbi:NAD(P)/FAD-dependent oxidoreductase [Miltoncostaea marina]|uniref:NAD(P)/FAD-dependent oxidoreductase n=1 Tax=Miltoncostaea marina TaxID=2843215 RepID=UPI001C3D43CC|nr:FAD-binding oxidoreductase [Miltoncostaea marina]
MEDRAGTLVVGGGIVGSAVAMHLAEMGEPGVVVLDPDLAGERSSSQLNAGGVRATWWRPVNIELCAATIDFMARHAEEFRFRERGYLWLHGPGRWAGAVRHVPVQNRHGREVELLTPAQVRRRLPFVDRVDDLAGATFSPRDGLVDPTAVRDHFRSRARAAGARLVDRALVVGARREGRRVTALEVREVGAAAAGAALEGRPAPPGAARIVRCDRVVNAAGPWAGPVARLLGAPVPCRAVPRSLCLVATRDVDLSQHGMIVDSSDVYLHHEAPERFLAGYSPPGDPPGYRFAYEGAAFFEREIWPRLAHRASAFDRLEHVRGWTGLYELSPDNSALLGRIGGLDNAWEAHSFSGRGVMQSWAAGLSLAELMCAGRFVTFPAAADLSGDRFRRRRPQPEELHI